MLLNSFSFLAFFTALAITYYAVPHRFRWPLLLAASVYFYATFSPSYVVLLFGVTLIAYWGGRGVEASDGTRARRALLTVSAAAVVGALLAFKYYDFFVTSLDAALASVGLGGSTPLFPRLELVLAVGLSFYTFSCLSYLVDVYARRLPAERHFGHFALYVSFFPKLLAGPIERAEPFISQIRRPVQFSASGVTLGLQVMLWGLFKKVVIADHLAGFVDTIYAQPTFSSPADLVLATYFFAFQLYCDFSGYSDMAIGASKILGIDLMENFRRPYLSTSVPEFWAKRWHLSLAGWFRDYMYVPMGGSRVSRIRRYGNVLAVFLVSGLWHGANWTFVVWGGVNGLYQVLSLMTRRARARLAEMIAVPAPAKTVLGVLVTFHLILVTWVFFRAESLSDAFTILGRATGSLVQLPSLIRARVMAGGVLFSLLLIALLISVEIIDERRPLWERLAGQPRYVRWGVYYLLVFGLIVLGTWQGQAFVYMQF